MRDLDDLIETANRFCINLGVVSENENKFCVDICLELEKMSWEAMRMMNDLKQIKSYQGGYYD